MAKDWRQWKQALQKASDAGIRGFDRPARTDSDGVESPIYWPDRVGGHFLFSFQGKLEQKKAGGGKVWSHEADRKTGLG